MCDEKKTETTLLQSDIRKWQMQQSQIWPPSDQRQELISCRSHGSDTYDHYQTGHTVSSHLTCGCVKLS